MEDKRKGTSDEERKKKLQLHGEESGKIKRELQPKHHNNT